MSLPEFQEPPAIRPLKESDLTLLKGWLNAPHLQPFYMQSAMSLDEVLRKFTPRILPGHPCHCVIAETGSVPFGYAQWYLNRDFADYGAAVIGKTIGVSIDYFIGETAYLGRGLGTKMLLALVSRVAPSLPDADCHFFIGHDDKNARAIRCTTAAGFTACASFLEDGVASTLFVREGGAG